MTHWFKHDIDARRDPKLVLLSETLGRAAKADWWDLIEILAEQPNFKYRKRFLPALAKDIGIDLQDLNKLLKFCLDPEIGLLFEDENEIWSPSLLKRMSYEEKKSENYSKAATKRNQNRTKTDSKSCQNHERVLEASSQDASLSLSSSGSCSDLEGGLGETFYDLERPNPGVLDSEASHIGTSKLKFTQAQWQELAVNHYFGAFQKLIADVKAASDHLRHTGESSSDPPAYIRKWQRMGRRYENEKPKGRSDFDRKMQIIGLGGL